MSTRRRRGLLLASVALVSGGLAVAQVRERERELAARVGTPVEVLVAARDIRSGARVTRAALGLRRVPARFVPPDALASAAGVVGARTAGPVVAGSYVTPGLLEGVNGERRGPDGIGRGRRAVTVAVAGGASLAGLGPGARVDVLVSTEPGATGGRTLMALAGAELIRLGDPQYGYADDPAGAPEPDGSTVPTALATLRVTLSQAVYLTAADNFAREIRLLARPPGDRSAAGATVSQGQL